MWILMGFKTTSKLKMNEWNHNESLKKRFDLRNAVKMVQACI